MGNANSTGGYKGPPILPTKKDCKHPVQDVETELCSAGDNVLPYHVIPTDLDPNDPDVISVLCISDTHGKDRKMKPCHLPPADILIHAGDFTNVGSKKDVSGYVKWVSEHLRKEKFGHSILIAGNHDCTFQTDWFRQPGCGNRYFHGQDIDCESIIQVVLDSDIIYLQDEDVKIHGLNIYGSPWQPEFCNWAFNLQRGEPIKEKWDMIPENTDILVTHGPPAFHGDLTQMGTDNVGCLDLLNRIEEIKPQFHVFGHIHEGYGVTQQANLDCKFINASTCTFHYKPSNPPVLFYIKGKRDDTNIHTNYAIPERIVAHRHTIEVQPGSLGMKISQKGIIGSLNDDLQDCLKQIGVQEGWKVIKINNFAHSLKLLKQFTNGAEPYTLLIQETSSVTHIKRDVEYQIGDSVIVNGLKSKPHYNGQVGTIKGEYIPGKDRWPVLLLDGAILSVRTSNLTSSLAERPQKEEEPQVMEESTRNNMETDKIDEQN